MNPSTGKIIGNVPDMNAEDAEAAIQNSYETFQSWKKTTAKVRIGSHSNVLKQEVLDIRLYYSNLK